MPITILDLGLDVLAYRAEGKIHTADIERIFDEVDVRMAKEGKFNVYAEVVGVSTFTIPALLKDIKRSFQRFDVIGRVDRAALVTDSGVLRKLAMIEDKVIRGIHVRVFGLSDAAEAQVWVRGGGV